MPFVGPYMVRGCLKCGDPYCGPGNGSPGPNCPAERREREDAERRYRDLYATRRQTDCSCPRIGGVTIHGPLCSSR
jgi:hypothetical protein